MLRCFCNWAVHVCDQSAMYSVFVCHVLLSIGLTLSAHYKCDCVQLKLLIVLWSS